MSEAADELPAAQAEPGSQTSGPDDTSARVPRATSDRHGIVAGTEGLMDPNHVLTAAIDDLYANRPAWGTAAAVRKFASPAGRVA